MARNRDDADKGGTTAPVWLIIAAVLGTIAGLAAAELTRPVASPEPASDKEIIVPAAIESAPPSLEGNVEAGAQPDSDAFNDLLLRARTAIAHGRLKDAERYLRRAADIDPDGPALFNMQKLLDIAKANIESG